MKMNEYMLANVAEIAGIDDVLNIKTLEVTDNQIAISYTDKEGVDQTKAVDLDKVKLSLNDVINAVKTVNFKDNSIVVNQGLDDELTLSIASLIDEKGAEISKLTATLNEDGSYNLNIVNADGDDYNVKIYNNGQPAIFVEYSEDFPDGYTPSYTSVVNGQGGATFDIRHPNNVTNGQDIFRLMRVGHYNASNPTDVNQYVAAGYYNADRLTGLPFVPTEDPSTIISNIVLKVETSSIDEVGPHNTYGVDQSMYYKGIEYKRHGYHDGDNNDETVWESWYKFDGTIIE